MPEQIIDPRLRRHELGFLELINKPSRAELANYYKNTYYQTERANYRKSYSALEMNVIKQRIVQKATLLETLMGGGVAPCWMLVVAKDLFWLISTVWVGMFRGSISAWLALNR